MKIFLLILLTIFLNTGILLGQESFRSNIQSKDSNQIVNSVFDDIELSIREGNVPRLSKYLGAQTYFSLSNGVNGYYSPNQAYYILEDFFNLYKVTAFKFNQISKDKTNPYATGTFSFDNKGKRNTAKVYISLKKIGDKWNITQLTIN
ncbi:DUF4783 domain-containing protein [Ignavibacterium album]|uniref:DUF4783 domain-containing protein n=1 Tax=Ignavibacterium album TaxID=591197 RepID=UPI00059E7993|nr:DUF4783 domain-containing protein [Ignavibacterium album]